MRKKDAYYKLVISQSHLDQETTATKSFIIDNCNNPISSPIFQIESPTSIKIINPIEKNNKNENAEKLVRRRRRRNICLG